MRILTDAAYYAAIAGAIRAKAGVSSTYTPSQMASAIDGIETGSSASLGSKSISANGTYQASSDSFDGYNIVTVDVANSYLASDEGKVVSNGALSAQTGRNITANGTYDTTFNNAVTVNVDGGGYVEDLEDLVLHTLSEIPSGYAQVVSSVANSRFAHFVALKSASLPSCKAIGTGAFEGCISLSDVSLPSVTSIYYSAFVECNSLSEVTLNPSTRYFGSTFASCRGLRRVYANGVSSIGAYMFNSCSCLSYVDFSGVTAIEGSAFMACYCLMSAHMESVTTISTSAFFGDRALEDVSLPNCTAISSWAFAYASNMLSIRLPKVASIQNGLFANCSMLRCVILDKADRIYPSAFYSCSNLMSLYLLGSSVAVLSSTSAFGQTPLFNISNNAFGWGSIYVPSSLYSSYKTAANWSNASIAPRIASLTSAQISALG